MQQYIVGLDIGSKTSKCAILELRRDGTRALLALEKFPSSGMKKGAVNDIADATQALSPIIGEIKKRAKGGESNIILGIGSSDVKTQSSVGVVAVSRADYEIYQDDISRAVQSAEAVTIPPNRMVLHAIVKEFVVDGVTDIKDPIGMVGNRLEVNTLIIDMFAPALKNMTKCVQMLGGKVTDTVLTPLADARAVLTKNQRELGVVLVDIGFGKTSMAVYEENKLIHAALFPVGSGNITNDLAIGLRIPIEAAEAIKLSFGSASPKEVSARDTLDLSKIDDALKGTATKKFIAEIIEVRLAEILEFVNNELTLLGKAGELPSGVVLVGGGVKLPGIVDVAKREFKLPVQIGIPDDSLFEIADEECAIRLEDPEFVCAVGLALIGYDNTVGEKRISFPRGGSMFKKIMQYFAP